MRNAVLGGMISCVAACGNLDRVPSAAGLPVGDPPERREPLTVEVVAQDGQFRLLRGGEPYVIRGAAFRTWSTGSTTGTLLDQAERLGLTVILCLDIGRERQGFDYDDPQAVAGQLTFARGEVEKYRDHPALLAWMIGNEPNLGFTNPRVFDAIDEISRMIHEVDGNHPTTVALASFNGELLALLASRAPDLDFVSMQMYGELVHLPAIIARLGYAKPFMVTEWGAIGHSEMPKTAWGAPIEQTSSAKADNYLKGWREGLDPARCAFVGRSCGAPRDGTI